MKLGKKEERVYQINDRTWALEVGDNIAFIRDGGGNIQLFAGDHEAMKSHDPDGGPHTYIEAEMIVLEVRKDAIQNKRTED